MDQATLALRNLARRRGRSLATLAGIALAIGGVVALASLARGFEQGWQHANDLRGTDLLVARAASENALPSAFPEALADDLRRMPGVAEVAGLLSEMLSVESAPPLFVFGWPSGSFLWAHLRLQSGHFPVAGENGVALGALAAQLSGKRVGDRIQVEMDELVVTGIFESDAMVENGALVMPLSRMQELAQKPGKVNVLNLRLAAGTSADDAQRVRDAITQRHPGYIAVTSAELARQNFVARLIRAMSWATTALALVAGALGVFNTMLMSVAERTREIGVLLAVGWRRRRVMRLILTESVLLAAAGGVAGAGVGVIGVQALQWVEAVRGKIEPSFEPAIFAMALGVALLLGLLGGLAPALRASRLTPALALHAE